MTITASRSTSSVPNLVRGMHVLEHFGAHGGSATITELSERLDIPTASMFRITAALDDLGYLTRDPATKRYALTNKLLLLAQPQGRERGLVEAALPAMRGLRRASGETTQLCCLSGTDNVILEQLLSIHPFKYSAELGARCPCYSCAPGKAIVAHLPDDEREELVARLKLKRFTTTTITTRRAFRAELDRVVERGFAVDRAEGLEGIHCVAAPIRDRHGVPVGALTIAGPASRVPAEAFDDLGAVVAEAAADAERRFTG